jgi:hypothetical protein
MANVYRKTIFQEVEIYIDHVLEALDTDELVQLLEDRGYQIVKSPAPVTANLELEAAYYAYHQRHADAAEIQHRVICDLLGRVH